MGRPTDYVCTDSVVHVPIAPADGFGHFCVGANVVHQLTAEVAHGGENPTIDHLPLNLGKPDFHLIQPRRIGWGEMKFHLGIHL